MIWQTENENDADVTVRFTVFANLRNAVISLPIRKHFRSFPKPNETKSELFHDYFVRISNLSVVCVRFERLSVLSSLGVMLHSTGEVV